MLPATPRRLFGVASLFVIGFAAMVLASTVTGATDNDLSGTYGNDRITLVLQRNTETEYTGTMTVSGESHSITGVYQDGVGLVGSFQAGGQRFDLNVQAKPDGTVVLQSEKNRHTLQRRGAAMPPTADAAANQPAVAAGDRPLNEANPVLPAFMKGGYRMYWSIGNSTSDGSSLVPDPKGWIIKDGKQYSILDHVGRGVEGIQSVTVQEATPQGILAEVRTFSIAANLQGKTLSTTGFGMVAGDAAALGDYWVNPTALAQLPVGREVDGTTCTRVTYPTLGKTFNAVSIFRTNAAGSASFTYDLDSGLLLAGYRSDRSPNFQVKGPNGTHKFDGSATIERFNFLGARHIDFAWANEGAPAWAAKDARIEYRGGYRQEMVQQGPYALPPQPGFPMVMSFTVQGGTKNVVVARWTLARNIDRGGLADQSSGVRCFGSSMYNGSLWASPGVLQKLQPNQVLDEDRVTGYRTVYAGIRGNVAVLVEQGPNEAVECYYDPRTGMLIGWKGTVQLIPGSAMVSDMQLVRQ